MHRSVHVRQNIQTLKTARRRLGTEHVLPRINPLQQGSATGKPAESLVLTKNKNLSAHAYTYNSSKYYGFAKQAVQ